MLPFLSALLALCIASVLLGDKGRTGTAAIILANWIIEFISVQVTHDKFPWMLFIVVDYLCGISLFVASSSRWGRIILAIYAVQIVSHAAYGLSSQGLWPQYRYWWALYYSGWAQLIVLGAWAGHEVVGRYIGTRRRKASLGAGHAKANG